MNEYGGYISFELEKREEYFLENKLNLQIKKFNSARSALLYFLKTNKITKVYCPYYMCESVVKALEENNIKIYFYYLDDEFFPKDIEYFLDEYIIWPNYFGVFSKEIINRKFVENKKIILDNTQAFFTEPLSEKINIYSCRKFLGVPDGAYLIGKNIINKSIEEDISYEKMMFLFKAIEKSTNEAYLDHLKNEMKFEEKKILGMSRLTQKILTSFDYKKIKEIRNKNFNYLHKKLMKYNEISKYLKLDEVGSPMVYPFLIENEDLREYLIKNKIYVPNWWKHLLEKVDTHRLEYKLSKYLLPLPIDQRYEESDMEYIANIIINFIEEKNEIK